MKNSEQWEIWVKFFRNGPSKICAEPLKNFLNLNYLKAVTNFAWSILEYLIHMSLFIIPNHNLVHHVSKNQLKVNTKDTKTTSI